MIPIMALALLPWRAIGIGVAAVALVGVVGGSIHSYGGREFKRGDAVGFDRGDKGRVVVQHVLDTERLAALTAAVDFAARNQKAAATLQATITEASNEIQQADQRARAAESLAATRLRTSQTLARAYTEARDSSIRTTACATTGADAGADRPNVLADVYGRCTAALEGMGRIADGSRRRASGVVGIYNAAREVSLQP